MKVKGKRSRIQVCVPRIIILVLVGSIRFAWAQAARRTDTADLPDAPAPVLQSSASPSTGTVPAAEPPLTLRKLPSRFVTDELHIFTSPARIHETDLKWLLPLAGATAAALSTDTYTMRNVVSHDPTFNNAASITSEVLRETAITVPVVMFAAGSKVGDGHTRETGLLGGESMIDAYVFSDRQVRCVARAALSGQRPRQILLGKRGWRSLVHLRAQHYRLVVGGGARRGISQALGTGRHLHACVWNSIDSRTCPGPLSDRRSPRISGWLAHWSLRIQGSSSSQRYTPGLAVRLRAHQPATPPADLPPPFRPHSAEA